MGNSDHGTSYTYSASRASPPTLTTHTMQVLAMGALAEGCKEGLSQRGNPRPLERKFFIDNLLVRVHHID